MSAISQVQQASRSNWQSFALTYEFPLLHPASHLCPTLTSSPSFSQSESPNIGLNAAKVAWWNATHEPIAPDAIAQSLQFWCWGLPYRSAALSVSSKGPYAVWDENNLASIRLILQWLCLPSILALSACEIPPAVPIHCCYHERIGYNQEFGSALSLKYLP